MPPSSVKQEDDLDFELKDDMSDNEFDAIFGASDDEADADAGDENAKVGFQETTRLPFRYVAGPDGKPLLPPGLVELMKKQSEEFF